MVDDADDVDNMVGNMDESWKRVFVLLGSCAQASVVGDNFGNR
jgi:hypothetical protein